MESSVLYAWAVEQCLTENQLKEYHYPRPHRSIKGKAIIHNVPHKYFRSVLSPYERFCRFCFKPYAVSKDGIQSDYNVCYYHPYRRPPPSVSYPCCGRNRMGRPCARRNFHCTEDVDVFKLSGFLDSNYLPNKRPAIYSLDCEFVQMKSGLALGQIIMIDDQERVVMNATVMPPEPIVDYLSQYSNLSKEDFQENSLTEPQFHAKLSKFLGPNVILIGHSLQCDLLKMKVIHHKVVDTARLFKHPDGPQFVLSLKSLALKFLDKQTITNSSIPKPQLDSVMAYRLVKMLGLKSNFEKSCRQPAVI